jgi:hypothetical protein
MPPDILGELFDGAVAALARTVGVSQMERSSSIGVYLPILCGRVPVSNS